MRSRSSGVREGVEGRLVAFVERIIGGAEEVWVGPEGPEVGAW